MKPKKIFIVSVRDAVATAVLNGLRGQLNGMTTPDAAYDYLPAGDMQPITVYQGYSCTGFSFIVNHTHRAWARVVNVYQVPVSNLAKFQISGSGNDVSVLFCFGYEELQDGYCPFTPLDNTQHPGLLLNHFLNRHRQASCYNVVWVPEEQVTPAWHQLLHFCTINGQYLDGRKLAAWVNKGNSDLGMYESFLHLPCYVTNQHYSLLKLLS